MEKPVLDSFSLEGLKQLGARLQSGRRVGSSPQQYLESITACGPATKHVLYVEVVPARYLKLEHVSDSEDDLGECTQDPLMERPPSSQHNPIKKKKSKDKDRDRVRDRAKHRERKLRKERERELKKELEIKKEIEKLEREQERSLSPSSTLPSLPSPPRSRSASPIIWSPKKKRVKKKRSKNPITNFLCNRSNCDYEANDINTLNSHKKSEHRGKDFQCDQCIYRGSTASDLRKHYRQHSGEIPYTCKMTGCDFRAKHNNSLVYHTKKYHPTGEPMKCDASAECIFTTYLKAALKHHKMMAHGGGKTLACETCPYKCYLMADLRKHHRVHTGENPYSCDFEGCRYACKISSNLKKHKRIHTEEKPYVCDVCEFRTNFINSLKVHKRTHTNERPYCCDQCGYRCNHTSNLKKHVSRLHPGAIYNIVKRSNVDTTSMGIQTEGNVP